MSDLYIQDILDSIKQVSMSESSLQVLLDFERVLDDMNIYAFMNWADGELVSGPNITKYRVEATFCWPLKMMPDPSGAERLLQYGAKITYKKAWLIYPIKIKSEKDYRPRMKKPKLARTRVWLVSINLPNHLIKDITKGSAEIMDQMIDLEDLDNAYQEGLDTTDAITNDQTDENAVTDPAEGNINPNQVGNF
jgi:hypothetical protein